MIERRSLILSALAAFAAGPGHARRRPYALVQGAADIRYRFDLSGQEVVGTAPVLRADLQINPRDLKASTAEVSADLRRVRAGLFIVTETLKGETILDVARYPEARFVSTAVRLGPQGRLSDGAALEGLLTLRGVTLPVRFDAGLYRMPGTAPDDLRELSVRLQGAISRSAFGASGYPTLVADQVKIDISAQIQAV